MFDVNNNYRGTQYGKDRLGFITPDLDASEPLQPFLPVGYPAPWLPMRRRDEGHPVAAGVVLSTGNMVGVDKSGGLIPAGFRSGDTGTKASGGGYCIVKYGQDDVGFAYNAATGKKVRSAGEYVVMACPTDAAAGDVAEGVSVTADDIAFAKTCDLIPGAVARGLGYALKNTFQYIGGVDIVSTVGGMLYVHDGMNPTKFTIHNYMHEMATAIRTAFVLRMPWVGESPTTLQGLADADGLSDAGYIQDDWSRSFAHFTGKAGRNYGQLFPGCSVVASDKFGSLECGNYAPYDPAVHKPDQIVGRVLGVEKLYPIRNYLDRVRTQFDRAQTLVGPWRESHPVQMMMGGSATRGLDYQLNLSGNGIFRMAKDLNKPIHDEYATYVYVKVMC
jgi:hypothetical protein